MNLAYFPRGVDVLAFFGALLLLSVPAEAQLTDITQTPNQENAGIQKSLEEQIGAGRGDVMTSDSSLFIIQRDPFRSIRRGRQVFQRKFTVAQGFRPRVDDGVGDIETTLALGAGLVDSCAGCHGRPRGAAGSGGSVFTRPESRDAPHLFGAGLKEMLADEITAELRALRAQAIDLARQQGEAVTRPLTSKGIHYFKPGTYRQTQATRASRRIMEAIGCTQCHIPDLPLTHDRRVADVETIYNPTYGGINNLFATATPLHGEVDDGSGFPPMKLPLGQPFLVRNIFADFKRYDLGPNFHERNFDSALTTHFMTAPLWGVGSTSPYGHDGRSMNLAEVILRHGGEAQVSRDAFA